MEHPNGVIIERKWPEKDSALKSPWVLGWFALIIVIFAANATMITLAIKTSPGLVEKDYYERGKNYELVLEKRAGQNALGWETKLLPPEQKVVNRPALYRYFAVDSAGLPIDADSVRLFAYRPSDAKADFVVDFIREGVGRYMGEVTFPLPGAWDLIVSIERGDDQFDTTQRIFIDDLKAELP